MGRTVIVENIAITIPKKRLMAGTPDIVPVAPVATSTSAVRAARLVLAQRSRTAPDE